MGALRLAGITGEISPHYTNQSERMKIDRVLVNIFYLSTHSRRTRTNPVAQNEIVRTELAGVCTGVEIKHQNGNAQRATGRES